MKRVQEVRFSIETVSSLDDLRPDEMVDFAAAVKARHHATPDRKHIKKGAAIRTFDEKYVAGWSVDEVLHAVSGAIGRLEPESRTYGIKRAVIVSGPDERNGKTVGASKLVPPCGECAHKLLEMLRPEDRNVRVYDHGAIDEDAGVLGITDPSVIIADVSEGQLKSAIRCQIQALLPLTFYPGFQA